MPKYVLGLDVSTSCTGICLIDLDIAPNEEGSNIIYLDRIEFKDCKSFFEKADKVKKVLKIIKEEKGWNPFIFALEEPLLGFSKGMSSATTITTLMRFNGIVSYIGRDIFGIDPTYISASHARKICGVKLVKRAIGGPQKEQVFKYMSENDLKHISWPKKKSGKLVDWSRDATDSYVIAKSACILYEKSQK